MVTLVKPQERVVQSGGQISQAAAVGGGLAQAEAGRVIEAVGEQYFQAARQADQTIEYSRSISAATENFAKLSNERYQRVTDEQGNPTHANLVDDIGSLGKEVRDTQLQNITDPEVAERFTANFDKFTANQQISAFSVARKQQIDFGKASLTQSLQSLQLQAVQVNPDQIADYEDQARQILDASLSSGLISAQEKGALEDNFRSSVRTESFRNLIENNPVGIKEELTESSLESLGLTENERDRLVNEADSRIIDVEREQTVLAEAQDREVKERLSLKVSELELGIIEGNVDRQLLETERDSLGEQEYLNLRKKLATRQQKEDNSQVVMNDISTAILDQARLVQFSTKQVDEHFKKTVSLLADPETGEEATFEQKAQIASRYKGPVKSFQRELETSLVFGSTDDGAEALQAYNFLDIQNPEALKNMPKEAAAIASSAAFIVENSNIDPSKAIETAREQVLDADNVVRSQLKADFRKIKEFKAENLEDFIIDQFDVIGSGSELLTEVLTLSLGGDASVAPGVTERIRPLLEEAFIETGSIDKAKKMVSRQIRSDFGETNFNGANKIMFAPPEKMFPNIPFEDQKEDIMRDVKKWVGLDIPFEDISIEADELTRGTFINGVEVISYPVGVVRITEEGFFSDETIVEPLMDEETGEIRRWFPGEGEIRARKEKAALTEAQRERSRAPKDDERARKIEELIRQKF